MKRLVFVFGLLIILLGSAAFIGRSPVGAQEKRQNLISQDIVIAGFYGGGGLSSGVFTHDYIILFNRGDSPVSIGGWSTQYASDSGTNWLVTPLSNATLQPGQYYLIQYASNGANGSPLPTPDVIAPVVPEGFIPNISSRDGKIALVNNITKLPAQTCPSNSSIIDFVGFGTAANCFEGVSTPDLTPSTAAIRKGGGCIDTDNNLEDFIIGSPDPKNTSSPTNTCNLGGTLQASGSASPINVAPGGTTLLSVTVIPATSPASTGIAVSGDLSQIGGAGNQQFFDDGTNGDVTTGDNIFSFLAVIPANETGGARTVTASATDAQSRQAGVIINLTINAPLPDENPLLLGNPSNATTEIANENNYLLNKPQYSLSYSRTNATPNWVAWRLDSSWVGSAQRQNDFRLDPTLPIGWYQVLGTDYSGSGFNRGHMCPSGDRTRSVADNSATFLMTNIIPQLSENNQGPWVDFENYLRSLASQGKEIYIFSGGFGNAGTIAAGKITVPLVTWKVVLVLQNGDLDLERVNKSTRTIAIVVPNQLPLNQGAPWRDFRKSVDQVEALTSNDFFSNVPKNTQELIERRMDIL